jgi:spermidine/putrescine transport system permease protein
LKLLDLLREKEEARAWLLSSPAFWYEILLFAAPISIVFVFAFSVLDPLERAPISFTLGSFQRILTPLYLGFLLRTMTWSLGVTVVCLLLGYPTAYYIAIVGKKYRTGLLMAIIIPFWTSFLTRTFSMISLLSYNGFLNQALLFLHLIQEPLSLLNNWRATIYGLVYVFLPMMVLPLYTSLEKFDTSLLEASSSLGAGDVQTFLRITLPLSLPGLAAGSILVFVPCLGAFIIPALLGGTESYMAANLIWTMFLDSHAYPLGSAFSVTVIAIVMVMMLVYLKFLSKKGAVAF